MTQPEKNPFDWSMVSTALVLAFIFWPWAVGVVDLVSWMLTATQVTQVPWPEARGCAFVVWPIVWGTIALFVLCERW